ncbi:Ammonium transporter [Rhynchospora pubera]|uniref:Ammonium transporter n=1 Tax=Rhynchospora pubera TaxID=906938 RepID=A0AAV8HHF3_9POAL|nr:Ammonium transporter [Rhynchospora pubera]
MATEAAPEWLNKGDNSWQLTASSFVALQSIGLVIIYGGIVKKKWAINSAFMALYAFAATLIFWTLWGFCMSFGDPLFLDVVGRPDFSVLTQKFMLAEGFVGLYPAATLVFFQFVFAAITLVLIAGALLGRMNFKAWMLFVPLWLTFSYTVGAFSIWSPKGFLFKAGVMDFAGGFVIHLSSGIAGFTAAYWVGPRIPKDRESFPPNNIIMTLVGAGLLWIGWAGFNGGAPYAVNIDSSLAIYNTHLCTATSLLVWLCLDYMKFGKPSVIGAVQGMVTGLVCITPAAGLVQVWAALIMGVLSGSIPWFTMMVLHKKIKFLKHVDDTLAIFHTHAIAGTLGGLLAGLFAEPNLNRLFFGDDPKFVGLIYAIKNGRTAAGLHQIGMQIAGIAFILVLNVVITSIICLIIKIVTPLRLSVEEMTIGDDTVHGEDAYAVWGDGETYEQSIHGKQLYPSHV